MFRPIRIKCPHGHPLPSYLISGGGGAVHVHNNSLMTNNKNILNGASTEKPVRKRIRDNHNELERARRTNQKAQLEALRMALPFQDMDEKASMVSIFVRAREYIGMLEQKIIELQGGTSTSPLPQIEEYPVELKLPSPQVNKSAGVNNRVSGRPRENSVNPDHIQIHHGVPFYNPGFMGNFRNSSIDVSALVSPTSSPLHHSYSPSNDALLNAEILRSFIADNYMKNGVKHRLSSEEEDNFMKSFRERRVSSLLMSLEADTVMVQKRDSLSALFSGLLPDFIDSSVINSGDEIKCHVCREGMCNMIMIDCDRCHRWYHIKCAKIDSDAIPTNWNCC